MDSRKRGKTVRSEARNIIRRIITKCDEEAIEKHTHHRLDQATIRASDYTGVSKRTICRIRKEDAEVAQEELLASPGKKRPRNDQWKMTCSPADKQIIRDIITEYYVVKKVVPSAPRLLEAVRERINFPWKTDSLRTVLKSMGFQWKKSQGIRRILIEKPSIVTWRGKYLKAIQHYRAENRNIIYIDETWVDDTICFSKCWQDGNEIGVSKNNKSSQGFIVVHAGGVNGFVTGAESIFKSRSTTGDYRGTIITELLNYPNFSKWVTEKLLPNIPEKSVIVMDNAPYHSVELNKPPSKYAKKCEILAWLVENNVPHTESMRKYELCDLIESHRKSEKVFAIDLLLQLHGHTTLRLPSYMCELNPIELAWAQVKRSVRQNNPSTLSASGLERLTLAGIRQVSPANWQSFCSHTEKLEKKYWEEDGLMEAAMENLNIDEVESEDDSTDDSSDGSDNSESP